MEISDKGEAINIRFFHTIDVLRQKRKIRGLLTFTKRYGLNYWNVSTIKSNPSGSRIRTEWLAYLVEDYGVSARYLLTGVGAMFEDSKIE